MKKIIMLLTFVINFTLLNAQVSNTVKDTIITLKVKGLTCKNDLQTIASNIKDVKGVIECKVGKLGATSSYKIIYNPAIISKNEIITVIENTPGCGDGDENLIK